MGKDDNKKILAEIKRIAEQGSPLAEEPVPIPSGAQVAPKKPIPQPPAKLPESDEVVIAKEDFDTLLAMAKKQDVQETLGQQIEAEKMQPAQESQMVQQEQDIQQVQAQPNLGIKSMDYGGIISRPTVLYFDTDRTCELIQPKVNENGSVVIGERTFDFTKGQPSILNMGGWGRKKSHPFYIIKYSSMNPIDIAEEYPETNPTPEQASRLIELGTLETLSKIPGGKIKRLWLILLMSMSMAMGAVAVYAMTIFGVI